jgi:3-hydroxybutyryl-CoA dehydrogenase
MKKIFIIGDNEGLIDELSKLIKDKCDIANELTDDVEIVFELTNYDREMKFKILDFIESKNSTSTVVSSSICMTVLQQCHIFRDPSRLIGAGFYPGFSSSPGIELARTNLSDQTRFNDVISLFNQIGKEVFLSPDRAGMISMRIISMIINEAFLVMQEGTSNKNDIDTAMRLGTNYPLGPIEWADKLGIELVYHTIEAMNNEFGEDRYRITPLLKERYLESSLGS